MNRSNYFTENEKESHNLPLLKFCIYRARKYSHGVLLIACKATHAPVLTLQLADLVDGITAYAPQHLLLKLCEVVGLGKH